MRTNADQERRDASCLACRPSRRSEGISVNLIARRQNPSWRWELSNFLPSHSRVARTAWATQLGPHGRRTAQDARLHSAKLNHPCFSTTLLRPWPRPISKVILAHLAMARRRVIPHTKPCRRRNSPCSTPPIPALCRTRETTHSQAPCAPSSPKALQQLSKEGIRVNADTLGHLWTRLPEPVVWGWPNLVHVDAPCGGSRNARPRHRDGRHLR